MRRLDFELYIAVGFLFCTFTFGASAQGQRLLLPEVLDDLNRETSARPTDQEFAEVLIDLHREQALTLDEWAGAWQVWRSSQNPAKEKEELVELVVRVRDSIRTARFEYDLHWNTEDIREGGSFDGTRWRIAFAGKQQLRAQMAEDQTGWNSIVSDDGTVRRTLSNRDDLNHPVGQIEQAKAMPEPVPSISPLGSALYGDAFVRRDDERDSSRAGTGLSSLLRQDDVYILEQTRDINGVSCVVVAWMAPPAAKLYLDPERNMAVVRKESFQRSWSPDEWSEGVWSRFRSVTEHSDLIEVSEGLWLPQKIKTTRYRDGQVVSTRNVQATTLEINERIPSGEFSDIFPDGTVVIDKIQGISYRVGLTSSVENLMDEAVARIQAGDGSASESDHAEQRRRSDGAPIFDSSSSQHNEFSYELPTNKVWRWGLAGGGGAIAALSVIFARILLRRRGT